MISVHTHTAAGMQVYFSDPDHEAYGRTAKEPDEVLAYLTASTNHWAYGQCQHLKERMTLRVPGSNTHSSNMPASALTAVRHDRPWVRSVCVHDGADIVLVACQLSVYGFGLEDGLRVFAWEELHLQRITHVRALSLASNVQRVLPACHLVA